MNAIQFIKEHGVDKAREVVKGAPDKTATHYVFRKIPSYYSVEFQSWYHDGEWWDSDCHTEQDLIYSYGSNFVLSLSDLKRLVESVGMFKVGDFLIDLHDKQSGLHKVEIEQCCVTSRVKIFSTDMAHSYWVVASNFRIATREEIAAWHRIDHDMGDDSHIENHVSKNCKVIDYD